MWKWQLGTGALDQILPHFVRQQMACHGCQFIIGSCSLFVLLLPMFYDKSQFRSNSVLNFLSTTSSVMFNSQNPFAKVTNTQSHLSVYLFSLNCDWLEICSCLLPFFCSLCMASHLDCDQHLFNLLSFQFCCHTFGLDSRFYHGPSSVVVVQIHE